MSQLTKWTPKKEDKFFAMLETSGGNVTAACRAVRMSRAGAYKRKAENEAFSLAWDEAVEAGTDYLEQEAYRRAKDGVIDEIYYDKQGEETGRVYKYSDTLMIFLLKARRPRKYRDNHTIEHKGSVSHDHKHKHTFDWDRLSDEELESLERLVESAASSVPG